MVALDMFDAASKITEAIGVMPDDQVRKAILMALVAGGRDGLLIDPQTISIMQVKKVEERSIA